MPARTVKNTTESKVDELPKVAQTESEPVAKPTKTSKSKAFAEPVVETKAEAKVEAKAEAKVEAKADTKAKKSKTKADESAEVAPEPEAKVEAKPKAVRAKKSKEEAVPETPREDAKTEVKTEEEPKTKPKAVRAKKVAEPAQTETDSEEGATRQRVIPTYESVMAEFGEILSVLEQQLAQLRDSSDKSGSIKFLRNIVKRVKTVQTSSSRVMKKKQPSKRTNNTNSGFMKEVDISPELAKFLGVQPGSKASRVFTTRKICAYIKEHDLQNPEKRKFIVPDDTLATLLGYDAATAEPLKYCTIQKFMKHHFPKATTA